MASNNADARKALSMKLNKSDPLLGQDSVTESPIRQQLVRHHHHHSYSSALLEHLVHLEKHIAVKADRIQRLNKMNGTAELALAEMISQDENGDCHRRQIADNFQRQYAYNIVSIEKNNVDLMFELTKVQELSSSLTRNPNVQAMISPTYMREECRAKAAQTVDEMNKGLVKNPRMIRLLKNLTTLLILTQNLSGDNKVFEGCLEEVRTNLFCSDNSEVFKKSVQARLEYIAKDITKSLEEEKQRAKDEETEEEPLDKEEEEEETGKTKTKEKQPEERKRTRWRRVRRPRKGRSAWTQKRRTTRRRRRWRSWIPRSRTMQSIRKRNRISSRSRRRSSLSPRRSPRWRNTIWSQSPRSSPRMQRPPTTHRSPSSR